jgi:hypothetical protein
MKAPSPKTPHVLAQLSPNGTPQLSVWRTRIENSDAQALWRALHRLVSVHPLVRSALGSQQASAQPTPLFSLHDLTQDLYVLLLQKGRFAHYLSAQMADNEIEREIFQIELTNLLIGNLRRRRPENYRIVRRVSQLLETDPRFRRFPKNKGLRGQQPARYRQAAEAVFGLREWSNEKRVKDAGTFSDLITNIPMRRRNCRRTGCTGDAQLIVSNQELVDLLLEIFAAIDSPAPLRVLRQLALSKLPVYDPVINPIEDEVNEEQHGRTYHDVFASTDASPEQLALRGEEEEQARQAAAAFLDHLGMLMRANVQRTERLWRVLWHCYFDPAEPSQLEIAEMVGISDSSVSDYRRKLEAEMRKLDFAPEQLRCFAEELDEQLRWRLSLPERPTLREEFSVPVPWPQYEYNTWKSLDAAPVV